MLREDVAEEHTHGVPEDDGVGHLHHGRLHVQAEQYARGTRILDLGRQELQEGGLAHEGPIDHFALARPANVDFQGRRGPVALTCSMLSVVSSLRVRGFSFERKSPAPSSTHGD